MTEPSDAAHLATRFLDLWQESLSAIASDAELLEALNRSLAALGFGAAALSGFMGAGFPGSTFTGSGFPGSSGFTRGDSPCKDPSAMETKDALASKNQKSTDSSRSAGRAGPSARKSSPDPASPPRTAPASSSSNDSMESVAELTKRLRLLEERLAVVASQDAQSSRSTPGRGRTPRSRAPRRRPRSRS